MVINATMQRATRGPDPSAAQDRSLGPDRLPEQDRSLDQDDLKSRLPAEYLLRDGTPDYLKMILTSRVYDVIKETPLDVAPRLSQRLGVPVLLKREDLTPVFSFKVRGAYNRMAQISALGAETWRGVVACSAGNHAQGVAYSAMKLKVPATIVMPRGAPIIKVANVERLGATVVLHGLDFDEAKAEAHRLARECRLIDIPPYDDPFVIAGQGTIGLEIARQIDVHKLHAIFCCVGGGGLISGVAAYIKRIAPHVRIIGCEAEDANAMYQSLKAGRPVRLAQVGLFADGAAVREVGREPFRIAQSLVDEVLLLSTDEICAAIKDTFEETRAVIEPAGALALAGLHKYCTQRKQSVLDAAGSRNACIAVMSGANMDFDRLRFVADRANLGSRREVFLFVKIPEQTGSFLRLNEFLNPRQVTAFSYRYANSKIAKIFVSVQVQQDRARDIAQMIEQIDAEAGFSAVDVSDEELTKDHIRYLVGSASAPPNERLISFEFPERPGALDRFLQAVGGHFNISLFHYRFSNGDVGKVLVGLQVPNERENEFKNFLVSLNYPFADETDNTIYREMFALSK